MGGLKTGGKEGKHAVNQAHQGFLPGAEKSGPTTGSGTRCRSRTRTLARANDSGAGPRTTCLWRPLLDCRGGTHKFVGAVGSRHNATPGGADRIDAVAADRLGPHQEIRWESPFSP